MHLADTPSRAYLRNNDETGALSDEIVHFAHLQPTLEDCLREIRSETQQDSALQELINLYLLDGLRRYLKSKMQFDHILTSETS